MQLIPKSEYDFYAVKKTSLNQIKISDASINDVVYGKSPYTSNSKSFYGSPKKLKLGIKNFSVEEWEYDKHGVKLTKIEGTVGNAILSLDPSKIIYGSPEYFARYSDDNQFFPIIETFGPIDFYIRADFINFPVIPQDEEIIFSGYEVGTEQFVFEPKKSGSGIWIMDTAYIKTKRTFYSEDDKEELFPQYEEKYYYFSVQVSWRLTAKILVPNFATYSFEINPALGEIETISKGSKDDLNWELISSDWINRVFIFYGYELSKSKYVTIFCDEYLNVKKQLFSFDGVASLGMGMPYFVYTQPYAFNSKTAQLPKDMLLENYVGENTTFELQDFPKSPIQFNPKLVFSTGDYARLYLWSEADPNTIYAILRDGKGYTKIFLPDEIKDKELLSFIVSGSDLLVFYSDYEKNYVASFYFAIYIEGDTITQDLSLTGFNRLLCYSPQLQKGGIITKVK